MSISVESRIHRTLQKLDRFKARTRWDEEPRLDGIPSPLSEGEKLLGVYENAIGRADQLLLFTDWAVHLWESGAWRSLRYSDIEASEWPTESKTQVHELVLRKKSGASVNLPVLGGSEHGRDLFVVMRCLDRIVEDINDSAGTR
jgi:hypothetical protein